MKHVYVVIMAGGRGERFWPLSTGNIPKPFLNLTGDKTLIQLAVERAARIIPVTRIFVVLGRQHLTVAKQQLSSIPPDNFLIEPEGRDTAPCIGLAAVTLLRRDSKATMLILPADHFVQDTNGFVKTIRDGVKVAQEGEHLVTIGIKPARPETGYGYIYTAQNMSRSDGAPCFKVERYVEKPDMKRAKIYCKDSRYYWNAGIFIWQAKTAMAGIKRHIPSLYEGLLRISDCLDAGKRTRINTIFKGFARLSIDYGLMEKAQNALMIPARFLWDDVGTWASLLRTEDLDEHGNYTRGSSISIDTQRCVIHGDDVVVGAIGVSDLVIVATKNNVLVCNIDRVQEVREIAKKLSVRIKKTNKKKR